MGGVGSLISFWTRPALVAACHGARAGRLCALVLVPPYSVCRGLGRARAGGSPLVVHRGQDAARISDSHDVDDREIEVRDSHRG